jgi:hypothetical protein
MPISDEKLVASTTYRKTGAAVPTQTWICALGGSRVGRIRAKYGVMVLITRVFNLLGNRGKFPYGDVGVVITVSDGEAPS